MRADCLVPSAGLSGLPEGAWVALGVLAFVAFGVLHEGVIEWVPKTKDEPDES